MSVEPWSRRPRHCDSRTVIVNGDRHVGYLTHGPVGAGRETGRMPPRRVRLTPAGWVALGVAGVLVVGLVVVAVVRLTGSPDCTVQAHGRTVDLHQAEAERAATAVASVVRRGEGVAAARAAVAATLSTSRGDTQVVADALTGRAAAALSCRHGGSSTPESDRLDPNGLTGRAEAVRQDVLTAFGPLPLGGFAPGGVHSGHMPGSAHYEGRAVDVFFRPMNPSNRQRGWALAQYLVARAARLSIDTVIFDARIWTARRADEGWRGYHVDPAGKSPDVVRVLDHRDHVHVDVAD